MFGRHQQGGSRTEEEEGGLHVDTIVNRLRTCEMTRETPRNIEGGPEGTHRGKQKNLGTLLLKENFKIFYLFSLESKRASTI